MCYLQMCKNQSKMPRFLGPKDSGEGPNVGPRKGPSWP